MAGFDKALGAKAGVRIEGLQETLADLEQMKINVQDMTVLHTLVAHAIRKMQIRNISQRKSGVFGHRWPPLAPATLAMRRKGSSRILEDTGRLRASIKVQLANHAGWRVGTNVAYAAIHQHGGMAGRGRSVEIPEREFIYMTNQDEDEMVDYYASEAASRNTHYIQWRNKQPIPGAGDFAGVGAFGMEF